MNTEQIKQVVEALSNQKQCDEDGTMCIVSRQAVEEAISALSADVEPVRVTDDFDGARKIADKIIADYKEHYDFPMQGESHMHDCITSALSHQSASQPSAAAGAEPNEALKTWPERIWIQHGDDDVPNFDEAYIRIEDMTWCHDKMEGADVEYVRADLAAPPSEAQAAPVDKRDHVIGLLRAALYAIGKTLDDDEIRSAAMEAYELSAPGTVAAPIEKPAMPEEWRESLALTIERLNDDAEMHDRNGNNSTAEDRRARAYEISQMLAATPMQEDSGKEGIAAHDGSEKK